MKKHRSLLALLITAFSCVSVRGGSAPRLDKIKLPPGFAISVHAYDVVDARTLFVGLREAERVYALPDHDRDNRADEIIMVAKGLETQGRSAWGGAVNLLVMPDAALLVSDDKANAIYTVSYKR